MLYFVNNLSKFLLCYIIRSGYIFHSPGFNGLKFGYFSGNIFACVYVDTHVDRCAQLCSSVHGRPCSTHNRSTLEKKCHNRQKEGSGAKYYILNSQYFSAMMTAAQVGSTQRRRTKSLKWVCSYPVGRWMCWRWSDDHLSSLLKWNMMVRVLCAISCLAQEAPIWSWVLSVLCCCVAQRCNGSCHCCCYSQCSYYSWSTKRQRQVRWREEEISFIHRLRQCAGQ